MGIPFRVNAAIYLAAIRRRSGDFIGAFCRHSRRCHRINDLFQYRPGYHARCYALKLPQMFSIQRILGRDQKFYDLLEASAQQADASVHHLIALLEKLEQKASPQSLEEFVQSRRKDKQITQELTEQLCKTFITPLEREDIQALSAALYKIPKTVEKIGERVLICPQDLQGRSFRKQVELLDQAAETVLAMVKQLRKGTDAATAREMNAKLQSIEGEADKLELDLLRDLYQGDYETKQIIFLRDLFELMEKVVDRCRDAGNIVLEVALKYS